MFRTLLLLPAFLLSSCIISIDVPEDQWDDDDRSTLSAHLIRYEHGKAGQISGRVVDASGAPVAAKVIAVYESGSYSQTCDPDGTFSMGPLPKGSFHLKAQTEDGHFALQEDFKMKSKKGIKGVELQLQQGSLVHVSYQGDGESYRCAFFHDGVRVDDFTLRQGERTTVVVPSGRVPVHLYKGDAVFAAQEVRASSGGSAEVVFVLD